MGDFKSVMNALLLAGAALYIAKSVNLLDTMNWLVDTKDPNPHVSGQAMAVSLQSGLPVQLPVDLQTSIKNASLQVGEGEDF
jgi:hypothetical protein